MEKMARDGHQGGWEVFFLPIQTLPTFWAEWIWILRIPIFYFLNPKFLDFQVPRSPNSQISRFPDFQTPPAPPDLEKLSDPKLTPLPTHPGIKYVARALAAIFLNLGFTIVVNYSHYEIPPFD